MNGMHFLQPNEYQPQAERLYEDLKVRLSFAIPYSEIEHIGSSAIAGAISKGDLDVLVRVSKEQFADAITAIESLGFSIKVGTLKTESLHIFQGSNNTAIQLIERGSEFEDFIKFRDRMNADSSLVEKYNRLKIICTGKPDYEYRALKSKFIETVLGEY